MTPASDAGAADLLEIDSVGDCFAAVGGKIHAWYKFALSRFESAAWIAKAEDDGLVDLLALQKLLGTLRRAGGRSHRWYVGRFAWTSTCWPLRESGRRHCAAPLGPATSKPDAPTRRDWDGVLHRLLGRALRYAEPGSAFACSAGAGAAADRCRRRGAWARRAARRSALARAGGRRASLSAARAPAGVPRGDGAWARRQRARAAGP